MGGDGILPSQALWPPVLPGPSESAEVSSIACLVPPQAFLISKILILSYPVGSQLLLEEHYA